MSVVFYIENLNKQGKTGSDVIGTGSDVTGTGSDVTGTRSERGFKPEVPEQTRYISRKHLG